MKINQVDTIKLFQLVHSTGTTNRIKSLSDNERTIVMTALSRIKRNKFDEKSDSNVKNIIKKLETRVDEPHKASSKIESFVKGLKNVFLLRFTSSMIQDSIKSIESKKKELDKRSEDLDNAITDKEILVKELNDAVRHSEKEIPILKEAHKFFESNYEQYKTEKKMPLKKVVNKYIEVRKRLDKLVGKDSTTLTRTEIKTLTNDHPEFKPLNDFAKSMKDFMKIMKKGEEGKYSKEIEAQIEEYNKILIGLESLISSAKTDITLIIEEKKHLETEWTKVKAENDLYTRLFSPNMAKASPAAGAKKPPSAPAVEEVP